MTRLGHTHFVQSLEPLEGGGLGGAARQLHAALLAAGSESRLVSTRSPAFSQSWPDVDQFVRSGPTKAFFARGLRPLARRLCRDKNGGMVVHGHGFYVFPNAVFGACARRAGVPLVYHPHGMFEPWILGRSRGKKRLAHWLFEDANFKSARLWRALTAKEADQIRGQGLSAPIVVLPNGIDLDEFQPAGRKVETGERTLLFLGRLHPKKGIELLLSAWAQLEQARKGWVLCLAGPDEGGYAGKIKALIERAGLGSSVSLPGTLVGKQKLEALQSADGFVLTSFSEGLPMAVLESMACGVPVLISHECNLPEVVEAGAGWACGAEIDAVRSALRELLAAGDAERLQRGAAGRKLVESRFKWSVIADELNRACVPLL